MMVWKDKYRVGEPLIDEQHIELFARVTDFLENLRAQNTWEERAGKVDETLNFMSDYVVTHFRDEEALQEQIGYPEARAHHKIHADMVSYVAQVAKQYEQEGYDERLMQQFAGKLLAWLINHVASEDQKIANYAKGKGEHHHG